MKKILFIAALSLGTLGWANAQKSCCQKGGATSGCSKEKTTSCHGEQGKTENSGTSTSITPAGTGNQTATPSGTSAGSSAVTRENKATETRDGNSDAEKKD